MQENHLVAARLWGIFTAIVGGVFLFFAPGIGGGMAGWWIQHTLDPYAAIYPAYVTVFIVLGSILIVLGSLIAIVSLAVSLYGEERLEQETDISADPKPE